MTIPKSYEALAADLASEKILSKTLLGQKEAYMMLTDNGRLDLATWKKKACEAAEREAALREELAALRESYEAMRDRKSSIVYLQQRLTVAEQRAGELEQMLADVPQIHFEGCDFQGWNQDGSEPFEFTDGLIKKIKSIRMVGWRCDGPRMAAPKNENDAWS